MNRNKLCELLKSFRKDDIICYAYRETVFHILSSGKCDGILYLISDVSANVMIDALTQRGFSEIKRGGENIDAKFAGQNVKVCVVDSDEDKFRKATSQPLTICSLLLRDDGYIYDECNGQADIKNKILRKTKTLVNDKNAFCTFCFELTLKRGYMPDATVMNEMKRMLTFPEQKKNQLMMSIREYIRSQQFNIDYFLNTLSYTGLFTAVGTISKEKKGKLYSLLRKANSMNIVLLLCYLVGIRGDKLKTVTNFDMQRDSYEKICRFVKSGETVDMMTIRNDFSDTEVSGLLFVAEFMALLSGEDFVVKEARSILFRTFDKSEFWKKILFEDEKREPITKAQNQPTEPVEKDMTTEPADVFGGFEDDEYEEDPDVEVTESIGTNSSRNFQSHNEKRF